MTAWKRLVFYSIVKQPAYALPPSLFELRRDKSRFGAASS
jgi:hypothetical protein